MTSCSSSNYQNTYQQIKNPTSSKSEQTSPSLSTGPNTLTLHIYTDKDVCIKITTFPVSKFGQNIGRKISESSFYDDMDWRLKRNCYLESSSSSGIKSIGPNFRRCMLLRCPTNSQVEKILCRPLDR